jgi:hypothetical protein
MPESPPNAPPLRSPPVSHQMLVIECPAPDYDALLTIAESRAMRQKYWSWNPQRQSPSDVVDLASFDLSIVSRDVG